MWGLIRKHFFSHISTAHYWYSLARSRASPFLLEEGALKTSVDTIWQSYLRRVSRARAVVSFFFRGGRECKQGGCVGGSYGREGTVVGVGVTVGVL